MDVALHKVFFCLYQDASNAREAFSCHHRRYRNREIGGKLNPHLTQVLKFRHTRTDHHRQLAVEIASRFNGEIINGDAMQLYHGLPIITNKMLENERKHIPHHLLGCIGLEEETWTVGKFVEKALIAVCRIS